MYRQGLAQSLEEFAAQVHATPENARGSWRLQGLRALNVVPELEPWTDTLDRLGPGLRIAPGLAVPTKAAKVSA